MKTSRNLARAINTAKKRLTAKWLKKGGYENFGEKTIRRIEDKYLDISDYSNQGKEDRRAICAFQDWCMNYTG